MSGATGGKMTFKRKFLLAKNDSDIARVFLEALSCKDFDAEFEPEGALSFVLNLQPGEKLYRLFYDYGGYWCFVKSMFRVALGHACEFHGKATQRAAINLISAAFWKHALAFDTKDFGVIKIADMPEMTTANQHNSGRPSLSDYFLDVLVCILEKNSELDKTELLFHFENLIVQNKLEFYNDKINIENGELFYSGVRKEIIDDWRSYLTPTTKSSCKV